MHTHRSGCHYPAILVYGIECIVSFSDSLLANGGQCMKTKANRAMHTAPVPADRIRP